MKPLRGSFARLLQLRPWLELGAGTVVALVLLGSRKVPWYADLQGWSQAHALAAAWVLCALAAWYISEGVRAVLDDEVGPASDAGSTGAAENSGVPG